MTYILCVRHHSGTETTYCLIWEPRRYVTFIASLAYNKAGCCARLWEFLGWVRFLIISVLKPYIQHPVVHKWVRNVVSEPRKTQECCRRLCVRHMRQRRVYQWTRLCGGTRSHWYPSGCAGVFNNFCNLFSKTSAKLIWEQKIGPWCWSLCFMMPDDHIFRDVESHHRRVFFYLYKFISS